MGNISLYKFSDFDMSMFNGVGNVIGWLIIVYFLWVSVVGYLLIFMFIMLY